MSGRKRFRPLTGQAEFSFGARGHFNFAPQHFSAKLPAAGGKVADAGFTLGWRGFKQLGEDRLVRGERGAVRRERNAISASDQQSADFRPGANWSPVSKTYKIEFKKERDLNKEKLTSEGILEISFELAAPDGFLYLDDLKLVPQG